MARRIPPRADGLPKRQADDQADSTAQFLDWCKKPFPGQGIYEYYRQRAQELEEQRKPQPVKTVWAIGSMEWQAEQEKAGQTAVSNPAPLPIAGTSAQDARTPDLTVTGGDQGFESTSLQR